MLKTFKTKFSVSNFNFETPKQNSKDALNLMFLRVRVNLGFIRFHCFVPMAKTIYQEIYTNQCLGNKKLETFYWKIVLLNFNILKHNFSIKTFYL